LFSAGCATEPELEPAPTAQRLTGKTTGAKDSQSGIIIEAHVDAWRWTPARLAHELTPIRVRIENESERALLLRYDEFRLATPAGFEFAALPPFDIEEEVTQRFSGYAYASRGFHVAPHLARYHPHFGITHHAFPHHGHHYIHYYPIYREFELPTRDMVARALPEGALDPGGVMTGFLYFADLEAMQTSKRITFRFVLIDAETRERFGLIEIPFVRK